MLVSGFAFGWFLGGFKTGEGYLLGVAAGLLGAYGLLTLAKLIGGIKGPATMGMVVSVTVFFIKIPAILVAGYLSYKLGWLPLGAFTVGVCMVYCALVWRAVRTNLF